MRPREEVQLHQHASRVPLGHRTERRHHHDVRVHADGEKHAQLDTHRQRQRASVSARAAMHAARRGAGVAVSRVGEEDAPQRVGQQGAWPSMVGETWTNQGPSFAIPATRRCAICTHCSAGTASTDMARSIAAEGSSRRP